MRRPPPPWTPTRRHRRSRGGRPASSTRGCGARCSTARRWPRSPRATSCAARRSSSPTDGATPGISTAARRAGAPAEEPQSGVTRLDCGGYPGFFVVWADFQQVRRSLYLYIGTCLLLVRRHGVWSKGRHGVWSCKTPLNHRFLWKTSARRSRPAAVIGAGAERPQEPRTLGDVGGRGSPAAVAPYRASCPGSVGSANPIGFASINATTLKILMASTMPGFSCAWPTVFPWSSTTGRKRFG